MIKRGVLGLMLVVALGACSGISDDGATNDGAAPPTTPASVPTSSTPEPALPPAADGKNYAACTDGDCEVLIEKTATLTIDGKKVTATVVDGYVQLVQRGPDGFKVGVSGSGGTSWGESNGPRHSLSLKAADGTTAVVVLTTR